MTTADEEPGQRHEPNEKRRAGFRNGRSDEVNITGLRDREAADVSTHARGCPTIAEAGDTVEIDDAFNV